MEAHHFYTTVGTEQLREAARMAKEIIHISGRSC